MSLPFDAALDYANRVYLANRREFEQGGTIPNFPPLARQIAGPSMTDAKDPAGNRDSCQGRVSHAQPGVSRVAQRPDVPPEDRETPSGLGSNPTARPATGNTNSRD